MSDAKRVLAPSRLFLASESIAAIGVAQIIQTSDLLYEGMRWAGVAFLLFLAWEGWQSGVDVAAQPGPIERKHFMRGLLTNLLNPKAGIFYVAVLPTFFDPDRSPMAQALILTAIYVGVATAVHAANRRARRSFGAPAERPGSRESGSSLAVIVARQPLRCGSRGRQADSQSMVDVGLRAAQRLYTTRSFY